MAQPYTPEITQDDKLWALLSYLIPLIGIIVLLMDDKKNRPFIKYHAVQSIALAVVQTVLTIVVVGVCTSVFYVGYIIYLAVKAYQGGYITIPVITDFVKKQGWVS